MGDNLMHQSVSLLHAKDPLFKRVGASRLFRFAIDDQRRMKIVEIGGAQELLNMLGSATDERTQKEAMKALSALSKSDEAVKAFNLSYKVYSKHLRRCRNWDREIKLTEKISRFEI